MKNQVLAMYYLLILIKLAYSATTKFKIKYPLDLTFNNLNEITYIKALDKNNLLFSNIEGKTYLIKFKYKKHIDDYIYLTDSFNSIPKYFAKIKNIISLEHLQNDEKLIVSISRNDLKLTIWNVNNGKQLKVLGETSCQPTILKSINKYIFAIGLSNGIITIWDIKFGEMNKKQVIKHDGSVNSILVLDDSTLISGSNDHTIKVWNIKIYTNINVIYTLKKHTNSVTCLVLLNNNQSSFASGSLDGTIKIWNTSCIKQLKCDINLVLIKDLKGKRVKLLIALNDFILASTSDDKNGIIQIWDTMSGISTEVKTEYTQIINGLEKLENGLFATCSNDRKLKIWSYKFDNTTTISATTTTYIKSRPALTIK